MSQQFPGIDEDRCADPIDNACKTETLMRDNDVALARSRAAPEQVQDADGSWPITECKDCGDDIPAGRLALARVRCVICQGRLDARRKLYGR